MSVKEETPNYVTYSEMRNSMLYLENRVSDQRRRFRLLIKVLVDKKVLSAELASAFEETVKKGDLPEDLLEWFAQKKGE